jgi:hypothetical protein
LRGIDVLHPLINHGLVYVFGIQTLFKCSIRFAQALLNGSAFIFRISLNQSNPLNLIGRQSKSAKQVWRILTRGGI